MTKPDPICVCRDPVQVPYPESGQRCVDKVIMEEKTVWDDVINCDHSYDTRCFTSMSTTYESVQVRNKDTVGNGHNL